MPKGKSKNQGNIVKDLEARLLILEEEKRSLSGQAESYKLFSLISELLTGNENISSILENSLEQIAVTKKLPYCSFCSVEGEKITPLYSYPKPETGKKSTITIQIGKKVKKEITDKSRVYKLSDTKSIKIKFNSIKKEKPLTYLLLIPFKSYLIPEGYFIFGDNKKQTCFHLLLCCWFRLQI